MRIISEKRPLSLKDLSQDLIGSDIGYWHIRFLNGSKSTELIVVKDRRCNDNGFNKLEYIIALPMPLTGIIGYAQTIRETTKLCNQYVYGNRIQT